MDPNALIECIPNFSEGRRRDVIDDIIAVVSGVSNVKVLDFSSDADHNRTVLTLAGSPDGLTNAIMVLFEMAAKHIDLTKHSGEHPRMGAVDVVPFVPLRNCTMQECVDLSAFVAEKISSKFNIPVILYEESATSENRRNLADVRKGQFEGMTEKLKLREWKPDFGEPVPHPTLGVTAVCARMPLIAFNVNLDTPDIAIATKIAHAVRHISGGLRYCKAMGVELGERRQTQVSMNLVNFKKTPIYRVMELIRIEARRYGVTVVGSEIVGLIPMEAITESFAYYIGLENYDYSLILESKL